MLRPSKKSRLSNQRIHRSDAVRNAPGRSAQPHDGDWIKVGGAPKRHPIAIRAERRAQQEACQKESTRLRLQKARSDKRRHLNPTQRQRAVLACECGIGKAAVDAMTRGEATDYLEAWYNAHQKEGGEK